MNSWEKYPVGLSTKCLKSTAWSTTSLPNPRALSSGSSYQDFFQAPPFNLQKSTDWFYSRVTMHAPIRYSNNYLGGEEKRFACQVPIFRTARIGTNACEKSAVTPLPATEPIRIHQSILPPKTAVASPSAARRSVILRHPELPLQTSNETG